MQTFYSSKKVLSNSSLNEFPPDLGRLCFYLLSDLLQPLSYQTHVSFYQVCDVTYSIDSYYTKAACHSRYGLTRSGSGSQVKVKNFLHGMPFSLTPSIVSCIVHFLCVLFFVYSIIFHPTLSILWFFTRLYTILYSVIISLLMSLV